MSNSPLAQKFIHTHKMTAPRNHAIDTITPHYAESNGTAESVAVYLRDAPDRKASANYHIGMVGEVVQSVDEENRSWCSSSAANDNRAVTIECNCYIDSKDGHVYGQLTDAAWKALVELCADICRRNGKTRLVYRGEADYSGLASTDMLLTMHKWFYDTDCPGQWLGARFRQLADEVNAKLNGGTAMAKLTYPMAAAEVMDHFIDHNAHGYSQPNRDGVGVETITLSDGTQVSFNAGDRDCSRLIQTCYVVVGALPRGMHMWTGNEREILLANGFVQVSLDSLQRGDVLWRSGHTEMYLGNNMEGGARQSEYGSTDGKTGDQTGQEIARSKYVRSHWTSAYRCTKVRPDSSPTPTPAPSVGGTYRCAVDVLNVRDAPSTKGNVVTHYTKGQTVTLDSWSQTADGCVWGRYTGASSGKRRYVAVSKGSVSYLVRA